MIAPAPADECCETFDHSIHYDEKGCGGKSCVHWSCFYRDTPWTNVLAFRIGDKFL